MPINYENDSDYQNTNEENQDRRDATLAKHDSLKKENVMDFDEFIAQEGIGECHTR